jgi:hypothetical protein
MMHMFPVGAKVLTPNGPGTIAVAHTVLGREWVHPTLGLRSPREVPLEAYEVLINGGDVRPFAGWQLTRIE